MIFKQLELFGAYRKKPRLDGSDKAVCAEIIGAAGECGEHQLAHRVGEERTLGIGEIGDIVILKAAAKQGKIGFRIADDDADIPEAKPRTHRAQDIFRTGVRLACSARSDMEMYGGGSITAENSVGMCEKLLFKMAQRRLFGAFIARKGYEFDIAAGFPCNIAEAEI